MSQINADTIATRDGSESTDMSNAINGSAKAWVNFNGTGTATIDDSFNVSSLTDNGTGDFSANFTTAMSSAPYAVFGQAGDLGSSNVTQTTMVAVTTALMRISTTNSSNSSTDYNFNSIVAFAS